MGNSASAREENVEEVEGQRVEEEGARQAAKEVDGQRFEAGQGGKIEASVQRLEASASQKAIDQEERSLAELEHVPGRDESDWVARRRSAATRRLDAKTAERAGESPQSPDRPRFGESWVGAGGASRPQPPVAQGRDEALQLTSEADEAVETCTAQVDNMAARFPHKTRSEIARDLKKAGGHAGRVVRTYKRELETLQV